MVAVGAAAAGGRALGVGGLGGGVSDAAWVLVVVAAWVGGRWSGTQARERRPEPVVFVLDPDPKDERGAVRRLCPECRTGADAGRWN